MQNLVLKFVSSSRAAGLRVSTSEVLDCFAQLRLVNPLDERQFSAVLRANFAKSLRDQKKFDDLYHLFFHEMRINEEITASRPVAENVRQILESLATDPDRQPADQAIRDFLADDPHAYLELLREIESEGDSGGRGLGSNLGSLVRRFPLMRAIEKTRRAAVAFLADQRDMLDWETRQDIENHLNARLDTARRLLSRKNPEEDIPINKKLNWDKHLNELGEIAFTTLTPREVEQMRAVIGQLVRKLKDTLSRRYANRQRGAIDIKKTLRRAAKYQGIPLEIVRRRKPPRKGKIVVLCDVSGSVWSSAKFMLNMLYSLQECFTKVRSFIFIAGLCEVTRLFEAYEINQAIEKVLHEADIEYGSSTDYGYTLRKFKAGYMDALNKKTTLIIIGDGRSNYSNPEEGILDEMREKCRRVIWLNPESVPFWYSGDSEMRTYESYCHEVRPCQNLNQLTEFIKELVL